MEIKTKFNMGDDIYFITNRGIRHGHVKSFNISPTNLVRLEMGGILHFDIKVTYDTDNYEDLYEEYCFSTKEELIDYLIGKK